MAHYVNAAPLQGTMGSTVAPTKTKRRHSVELSTLTYDTLIAMRDDDPNGFVFSDDGGVTAWKPNWVTKTYPLPPCRGVP